MYMGHLNLGGMTHFEREEREEGREGVEIVRRRGELAPLALGGIDAPGNVMAMK